MAYFRPVPETIPVDRSSCVISVDVIPGRVVVDGLVKISVIASIADELHGYRFRIICGMPLGRL